MTDAWSRQRKRAPLTPMDEPLVRLVRAPDGGLDFVCAICKGSSRLHPEERFVGQVELFLEQHRHEDVERLPS